ncbi:MAG: hypothetical protein U1E86_13475 [Burkholderiaceae bacterium]
MLWHGRALARDVDRREPEPDHGSGADELIRRADAAMYRAKLGGGNRYTLFSGDSVR